MNLNDLPSDIILLISSFLDTNKQIKRFESISNIEIPKFKKITYQYDDQFKKSWNTRINKIIFPISISFEKIKPYADQIKNIKNKLSLTASQHVVLPIDFSQMENLNKVKFNARYSPFNSITLTKLTVFYLNNNQIKELHTLFPNLRSLSINEMESFNNLNILSQLTKLKTTIRKGSGDDFYDKISSLTNLRKLNVVDYIFKEKEHGLDKLFVLTKLEKLSFYVRYLETVNLNEICCLNKLVKLEISSSKIPKEKLKYLKNLVNLKSLNLQSQGKIYLPNLTQINKLKIKSQTLLNHERIMKLSNIKKLKLFTEDYGLESLFLKNIIVLETHNYKMHNIHEMTNLQTIKLNGHCHLVLLIDKLTCMINLKNLYLINIWSISENNILEIDKLNLSKVVIKNCGLSQNIDIKKLNNSIYKIK